MRYLGDKSGSLGITRCNVIGSPSLGIFVNGIHEAARCERAIAILKFPEKAFLLWAQLLRDSQGGRLEGGGSATPP